MEDGNITTWTARKVMTQMGTAQGGGHTCCKNLDQHQGGPMLIAALAATQSSRARTIGLLGKDSSQTFEKHKVILLEYMKTSSHTFIPVSILRRCGFLHVRSITLSF